MDECISNSFSQCGHFDFDGGIYKLYLKLRDTISNREVLYKFVKNVNVFIDEMKSIGANEIETNDYKELDENDFALIINEVLDQRERESGSNECDVDIE